MQNVVWGPFCETMVEGGMHLTFKYINGAL